VRLLLKDGGIAGFEPLSSWTVDHERERGAWSERRCHDQQEHGTMEAREGEVLLLRFEFHCPFYQR
jgi:hypothetical protein